jgi:hypothetical protein
MAPVWRQMRQTATRWFGYLLRSPRTVVDRSPMSSARYPALCADDRPGLVGPIPVTDEETPAIMARKAAGRLAQAARSHSDLADIVLLHHDPEVRRQAIPRLRARFRDEPTTLTVLASASRDADPDVRVAAGSALADVAGKQARALIVEQLDDPEFRVRLSAAWTLKLLCDAHPPGGPDTPGLGVPHLRS